MFAAFRPIDANRLRENVGLAFEDFEPGQLFHHRPGITVTQQDNIGDSLAMHNQAAIHYDHHYARGTEFKLPLVVSTLTLQRAIGMAWKTFGRRKRIDGFRSITLTAPVFGGDTLYSRSRILESAAGEDAECGLVTAETTLAKIGKDAANNVTKDVATVVWQASIYRRERGPFAAFGY
jgi:itaconyl-CoA hydratase